mgnify:CR=1 FL=1
MALRILNNTIPLFHRCVVHHSLKPVSPLLFRDYLRHYTSSTQTAVNNILYNVPSFPERVGEHVFAVLVDNQSGLLSKISGMLSARGFNIDSLTASKTDVEELSRITLRVNGPDQQVEQCRRQLEDLVEVWAVIDYTDMEIIQRDLILLKVSTIGRAELQEKFQRELSKSKLLREVSSTANDVTSSDKDGDKLQSSAYALAESDNADTLKEEEERPPILTRSNSLSALTDQELLDAHKRRSAVTELAKLYGGEIVDVGREHVTVQLVTWPRRVDAFIKMMQPYGIVECARTGMVALPRSRVSPPEEQKKQNFGESEINLPPSSPYVLKF